MVTCKQRPLSQSLGLKGEQPSRIASGSVPSTATGKQEAYKELEDDVEGSAQLCRCHLRQVHGPNL